MAIDGKSWSKPFSRFYLNSFEEGTGKRARKRVPWSVTDSLHEKSYISDVTKNKSVWLSEKGAKPSAVSAGLWCCAPYSMPSFSALVGPSRSCVTVAPLEREQTLRCAERNCE